MPGPTGTRALTMWGPLVCCCLVVRPCSLPHEGENRANKQAKIAGLGNLAILNPNDSAQGGELAFCVYCGFELKTSNCSNCGVSSNGNSSNPDASSKSRSSSSRLLGDQARIDALKAEKKKRVAAKQKIIKKRRAARAKFVAQNRVPLNVFAAVGGLALAYGVAQSAIYITNGPETTVNEYLTAVQQADWGALSNQQLFPGSRGTVPELIKSGFGGVKEARVGAVVRDWDTASATIFLTESGNDELIIDLVSKPTQVAVFSIPKWYVVSKAPTMSIEIGKKVQKKQELSAGDYSTTVNDVKDELAGKSVSVLPGVYDIGLGGIGFYNDQIMSKTVWGVKSSLLQIESADNQLTAQVVSKAQTRAVALSKSCSNKKCSRFPKYKATNFNLWSQYQYKTYTSSRFTYKIRHQKCTLQSSTIISHDEASLVFGCTSSVKANLYVRYTYYYGYYSDYWWYWNFKDSTTASTKAVITMKLNKAGKTVISKARLVKP